MSTCRVKIPFNRPFLGKEEISGALKALKSGKIGGNGVIGEKTERIIEDLFKAKFVLLTTSCTHAMEMALMVLGIQEDDEVILPSFGFVSTANAIARLKARPVFVDVEDESLNIDPLKIRKAITGRTKAIICVHYAGVGCNMKKVMETAKRYNLHVIEDAAQAVGSKYGDSYLGTIGDIGCFSFHETKNFTCGEGGAFLTNNRNMAERAKIVREKGTNRSDFLKGKVDKYTWVDIGSSYVLSEILAAVIFEQFKKIKYINKARKGIGLRYIDGLKALQKDNKISLPKLRKEDDFNWHIFYFRVRDKKARDSVLAELRQRGIEATFHFVPLHLSPYAGKKYGYKKGDFPVSEKAASTLIRLPIYPGLKKIEQDYIMDSVHSILKR